VPFEPVVRTRVLVREVMNSPVLSVLPNEDVQSIASKMSAAKVGSVVVQKEEIPVGIITDGDIVSKVVSKNSLPNSIKAEEIMTTPLRTIESEKEIIEAARQMLSQRIKRLGVTYRKTLVGIISISDILAITPELFDIISEKRAMMATESNARQPGFLAGYCDHCNQWSDVLLEMDNKFLCEECRTGKEEEQEQTELPE
jgi:signal-transduction protein with cAMP-binding, CBS, and nucleotidyltransferase domain